MSKRTGAVLAAMTIAAIVAVPVVAATPKVTGTVGPTVHDQDAHEADEGGQVHARRE